MGVKDKGLLGNHTLWGVLLLIQGDAGGGGGRREGGGQEGGRGPIGQQKITYIA